MAKRNPLLKKPKQNNKFVDVPHSAGILDDHAVRKNIATREGTIEKVPVNDSDIANKKYVDDNAGLWEIDGTETQLKTADEIDMQTKKIINVTDPTNNQDAATKKYVDDNAGVANPAGNDTEVQFNDGGSFGASASFTWDDTKLNAPYLNATDKNNIINLNGSKFLIAPDTFNLGVGGNNMVNIGAGCTGNVALGNWAMYTITTGDYNMAIGYGALLTNNAQGNVGIGFYALKNCTGSYNFGMGYHSLYTCTVGSYNVAIGQNSLQNLDDYYNVGIGDSVMSTATSARGNTVIGRMGAYLLTTGDYNIMIGYKAGYNQTTNSNLLIIDNQDRGSIANEAAQSLVYGVFNATPSSQSLIINGDLNVRHHLVGIPDEITATSEGVAASIDTLNTEVTTNGDQDLDNVTLANGTSGQIKHIYCVVLADASDTWKITPASMVGGSQITFTGAGQGCTLVYADNEGWVVIGNNGGTIS